MRVVILVYSHMKCSVIKIARHVNATLRDLRLKDECRSLEKSEVPLKTPPFQYC